MVKFGARFEASGQNRRWASQNVDYERLKLLLKITRSSAVPAKVGLCNFGRRESEPGLLKLRAERDGRDAFLRSGLSGEEREQLEALRVSALKAFGDDLEAPSSGELAAPACESEGHWTRFLFRERTASGAFLLHGFDVALMSEIVESEALYAREVEGMFRRWRALRPSGRPMRAERGPRSKPDPRARAACSLARGDGRGVLGVVPRAVL